MTSIERALFLLASQLDDSELLRLFQWVEQTGARQSAYLIQRLQKEARKMLDAEAKAISAPANLHPRTEASSDNLMRVEELLLGRTGLSKSEAIQLLITQLERVVPSNMIIPGTGKKSFHHWLARLSEIVPPSILLAAASQVRRDVQRLKGDWPLSHKP